MEFFEFFFTGPGWGWRAFVLILIIGSITNMVSSSIQAICSKRDNEYLMEIIREYLKSEQVDKPATKDDVRS